MAPVYIETVRVSLRLDGMDSSFLLTDWTKWTFSLLSSSF